MTRFPIILGLLILGQFCRAQNDLQKCSEEKNNEIHRLIKEGKGSDTASLNQFIQLDKKWKDCVVGKVIPDFSVRTINGKLIDAESLKGKVIVANFWFTTCPPCIAEIPSFNRLVNEYENENIYFLGFAVNDKKTLNKFLKKSPFNFNIIPDSETIDDLFGVIEHPVTFIIDRQGKVRAAWAGGSVGEKAKDEAYLKIKPVIEELLAAEYRSER